MLFRFITDNEYERLTNPDAVNEDMSNHFDGLCKSSILSTPEEPLYAFYDQLDKAFVTLDDDELTYLVAIDDTRVAHKPGHMNGYDSVLINSYTLMDVFFIWKGTRKHALERVYENRIFPYTSASKDEDTHPFRAQGHWLNQLPRPSELTFSAHGLNIVSCSDRYVAISFDDVTRRFVIVADALGYGFKSHDSCQKFITKSHDKYIAKERQAVRRGGYYDLETAYEQASYCGFGDYADYC